MPKLGLDSHSLADYVAKHRDRTGWWWNFDKYIVSLLKAYYGEAANKENDWGFDWLPIYNLTPYRYTCPTGLV